MCFHKILLFPDSMEIFLRVQKFMYNDSVKNSKHEEEKRF